MRSWDGFRVPRPFARVLVAYGEPLEVPPGLDEAGVEAWRRRLEGARECRPRGGGRRGGKVERAPSDPVGGAAAGDA